MRTPAEILQWREGYDVGYREGGGSEEASLSIMMDELDLPEGVIAEEDYDTIRNMAKRIKELEDEDKIRLIVINDHMEQINQQAQKIEELTVLKNESNELCESWYKRLSVLELAVIDAQHFILNMQHESGVAAEALVNVLNTQDT